MRTKLTEKQVRETLPCICVKWKGKRYTARVTGRLATQASVSPYSQIDGRRKFIRPILGPIFKVPFAVITSYVGTNKTLNLSTFPLAGEEISTHNK